jgi:uncharacterized protein
MFRRMVPIALFPPGRPRLIGMIHLLPLPGSPGWSGSLQQVTDHALADAETLTTAGFDALMVENFGDVPFRPEHVDVETAVSMAALVDRIRAASAVPVGVNVLRNDALTAMAIAAVLNAAFIRVNVHTGAMLSDQGWLQGRADETLRLRTRLQANVAICADVLVKHAIAPPGADLAEVARDTFARGLADVLIVSGRATGAATNPQDVLAVKRAVPAAPVWVGSGVTAENAPSLLQHAEAAIVGSSLKADALPANPIDRLRAEKFVEVVRSLR